VSEATDKEMRDAVERWARARGFTEGMAPWYAMFVVDRIRISRRHSDYKHRAEVGKPLYERTETSPHDALAWALVLEARPLRDGSDCKRCRGRGTWDEWDTAWFSWRDDMALGVIADGWRSGPHHVWRPGFNTIAMLVREGLAGHHVRVLASRAIPCPDCEGTGLADLTDAYAQHVLDAQPRPNATGIRFITSADTNGVVVSCRVDGANEASIEALHVLADRLQAAADPLGFDIAHLLAGSHEGTASAVERLDAAANLLHKLRWDAARSSGAGTWP
jgi:hypothetical protein